ncbi:MAG: glycosyltransferase family 2 protein [Prevotella sp.]|nr:glycosyltransferase family 2 protein [Prevotella sp.]
MNKLLTLVIPTYNMEAYLSRCLDSLILKDSLALASLEVLIVNDGSKDRSSEIARVYQSTYPQSFRVIDKDNGNYGSCINRGLIEAKGKYFKILDADDWYDTEALKTIIDELNFREEDTIFTKYTINRIDGKKIDQNAEGMIYGEKLLLTDFNIPSTCLEMHSYMHKTSFLRSIDYKQTEGVSYTDTEYVYFPLSQAKTLYGYDISLYQYYVGREGQTVSASNMRKGYSQYCIVLNSILTRPVVSPNNNWKNIQTLLLYRLCMCMINIQLVGDNWDSERSLSLKGHLKIMKEVNETAFNMAYNTKKHAMPYVKWWFNESFMWKPCRLAIHFLYRLNSSIRK